MNWTQGLFRIWLLFSVLWLAAVGDFASKAFWVPVPFYGNYQHSPQIKEMPWKTDWSKPYYEITDAPGKGKFPESFATLDDQYVEKWDEDVKAGRTVEIDFPDGAHLYLTAQLTKDDQKLLANLFWEQRWRRYADKILPWLALAFGPPLTLILGAIAVKWIARGFRHSVS
jgi:hypothetical protein